MLGYSGYVAGWPHYTLLDRRAAASVTTGTELRRLVTLSEPTRKTLLTAAGLHRSSATAPPCFRANSARRSACAVLAHAMHDSVVTNGWRTHQRGGVYALRIPRGCDPGRGRGDLLAAEPRHGHSALPGLADDRAARLAHHPALGLRGHRGRLDQRLRPAVPARAKNPE